jgi:hypothetical protein
VGVETEQATEQQTEQTAEDSVLKAFESGKVPGEETEPEQTQETQETTEEAQETQEAKPGEQFEANARLERQNRELQEQMKKYQELQEAAKQSPSEALKRLGIDPMDYLMELDGDQTQIEPVEQVKSEVEQLKDLVKQQSEDLQKTRIDSFVEFKRREIADEARRQAEELPFASMALNRDPSFMDEVMRYAVAKSQETGQMPDAPTLLKAANDHVVSAFMKNLDSFFTAPGGVSKVQEALSKVQKPEQEQADDSTQASKTLTNNMSSEQRRETNPALSDEEAEQAFLKAMKESGWVGED